MKKAFLFLSAICLVGFSSCSDDDDNPNTPPPTPPSTDVLVKRIVAAQDDADGINYDVTYTYNGNKLVQGVYTDGMIEKYYYTGNQITKIEYIVGGDIDEAELFEYDTDGQLEEYRYQDLVGNQEDRNVYVYNDDNTVTVSSYVGTINNATLNLGSVEHEMQNGEIISIIHQDGTEYNYAYDSKNSPFKNVTGFAAIADAVHGDYELFGKSRNIVSIVELLNGTAYMTNTIQYNSDNYPTSVSSIAIFETMEEELTVQYFY